MAKKAATKKKVTKKAARKKAGPRAVVVDTGDLDARLAHPPPVAMDAIIGQDAALRPIDAAIRSGRVHHCWLFHGPRGVGKFTAALAFAALLLDPEAGPDLSGRFAADPESRVQRLLAGGGHPDLHVVTKELAAYSENPTVRTSKQTRIPLDVVREFVIKPAGLAANVGPGGLAKKVFIIDEAEMLAGGQNESQNALLKTLEEPPDGTVIMLVTSNEDRLLPTIRSRSQRVGFTPLTGDEMNAWLAGPGREATGDADPAAVAWLRSSYAAGSPGRLIDGLTYDLYAWHTELDRYLNEAAGGTYAPELGLAMHRLIEKHADGWVKKDKSRSKDVAGRAGAARMFSLLAERARGLISSEETMAAGLRWVDAISLAEQRLTRNTNRQLLFEGLAADLADDTAAALI